jgi:hypothetical protein
MSLWAIWCKTLGGKISDDNRIADKAALFRTIWILLNAITCMVIIANAIHHW